jgi:hypothetical protein
MENCDGSSFFDTAGSRSDCTSIFCGGFDADELALLFEVVVFLVEDEDFFVLVELLANAVSPSRKQAITVRKNMGNDRAGIIIKRRKLVAEIDPSKQITALKK